MDEINNEKNKKTKLTITSKNNHIYNECLRIYDQLKIYNINNE